jgi:hypothetical protein
LNIDAEAKIEWNRGSINVYVSTTILQLQADAEQYIISMTLEININTQITIDGLNGDAALRIQILIQELEDLW